MAPPATSRRPRSQPAPRDDLRAARQGRRAPGLPRAVEPGDSTRDRFFGPDFLGSRRGVRAQGAQHQVALATGLRDQDRSGCARRGVAVTGTHRGVRELRLGIRPGSESLLLGPERALPLADPDRSGRGAPRRLDQRVRHGRRREARARRVQRAVRAARGGRPAVGGGQPSLRSTGGRTRTSGCGSGSAAPISPF